MDEEEFTLFFDGKMWCLLIRDEAMDKLTYTMARGARADILDSLNVMHNRIANLIYDRYTELKEQFDGRPDHPDPDPGRDLGSGGDDPE
jgi:hypothetical protein